ncbi:hypothetical protein RFI_15508, partial [Reticulomyxa filosa]
ADADAGADADEDEDSENQARHLKRTASAPQPRFEANPQHLQYTYDRNPYSPQPPSMYGGFLPAKTPTVSEWNGSGHQNDFDDLFTESHNQGRVHTVMIRPGEDVKRAHESLNEQYVKEEEREESYVSMALPTTSIAPLKPDPDDDEHDASHFVKIDPLQLPTPSSNQIPAVIAKHTTKNKEITTRMLMPMSMIITRIKCQIRQEKNEKKKKKNDDGNNNSNSKKSSKEQNRNKE